MPIGQSRALGIRRAVHRLAAGLGELALPALAWPFLPGVVPVSAVRDLCGSDHNEGASKGILVTTSGCGRPSFEFGKGKPLELLSGSQLLYLLKVHADVDAKIEPPEHWEEPRGGSGSPHWDEPNDT